MFDLVVRKLLAPFTNGLSQNQWSILVQRLSRNKEHWFWDTLWSSVRRLAYNFAPSLVKNTYTLYICNRASTHETKWYDCMTDN